MIATNALHSDIAAVAILLGAGLAIGLVRRRLFDWHWLLAGVGLVWLNSALLLRCYGLIPDWIGGAWNWEGKLLALAGTLLLAGLPRIGWPRAGITLRQNPGSWRTALPVALVYCALFVALALAFPADHPTHEEIAFQLTMPGLEEEPFYRGLLLLAFDRAFLGRLRLFGVDRGTGAVLSCLAFGLAHALGYRHGAFSFDALTMAVTTLPAFVAVWLCYRTGSVALPVVVHNFGNAIGLLI